jgi:hypothetical protein
VELTRSLGGYHAMKRKLAAKASTEEEKVLQVRRTVSVGVTLLTTPATSQPKLKRKRSGGSSDAK